MKKWNLIVDVANCTNCNLCVLAVQDEYVGNEFPGYAAEMPKHGHKWIDIKQKVRGQAPMVDAAYLPVMCQHCDDAPCIDAAENDAVTKRPDGIVVIHPEKAKGQKHLVDSCPYGAIWWNEDSKIPQHWNFDAHLIDEGWSAPRADKVCATEAIRAVKVEPDQMEKMVEDMDLEHLHPEYGTNPRVWYKNLYRYRDCFIAGSVAADTDGVVDCVEGAAITLLKDSNKIATMKTDIYGDFKFDRLPENSGEYTLEIHAEGQPAKLINVALGESQSITDIRLP